MWYVPTHTRTSGAATLCRCTATIVFSLRLAASYHSRPAAEPAATWLAAEPAATWLAAVPSAGGPGVTSGASAEDAPDTAAADVPADALADVPADVLAGALAEAPLSHTHRAGRDEGHAEGGGAGGSGFCAGVGLAALHL
jgi:hypothetical protein